MNAEAISPSRVKFEAFAVPERITMPDKNSPKIASVLFVLKILNETSNPILIDKYSTPLPQLETKAGQKKTASIQRGRMIMLESRHFFLIQPNNSGYIFIEAKLGWENNRAWIGGSMTDGGNWIIDDIDINSYKLSLHYRVNENDYPGSWRESILQSIKERFGNRRPWVGDILTQPISFTVH